uniref:Uncharacterized protein n=1 Tax=Tanacetum cinerariifolium TaxID=118510 RepID=A0A6L2LR72_TANCI|nr:hypothetical protein [Tanacetum cinerariifolium]
MGLTEGERGFEQTKECYLIEVVSFFKTIKEHFEGIQKALTKEIKEIKGIFEELKAEVDQNFVNRKCDEIEQKNLFIANDNLVVDCLSKEVFLIATNSALTELDLPVPVPESFHEQTDEELTENDIKRMDADDQAIQTILLGLPEDVYAAIDSCETAKEIWERVRQMMKGSDIGEHEKKAKLFNE